MASSAGLILTHAFGWPRAAEGETAAGREALRAFCPIWQENTERRTTKEGSLFHKNSSSRPPLFPEKGT